MDMKLVSFSSLNITFRFVTPWIFGKDRKENTKYYLGSLSATTPTQTNKCQKSELDLIHNSFQNDGEIYFNTSVQTQNDINVVNFLSFCYSEYIENNLNGRWIKTEYIYPNINISNNPFVVCNEKHMFCGLRQIFIPYECEWKYKKFGENIY